MVEGSIVRELTLGGAMKLRNVLMTICALASTGCVTAPPAAESVRITTNPDVVRGCKFISNVSAWTGWGGTALGDRNMEESLKAQAYKLGANTVYVNSKSDGAFSGSARASSESYSCSQ